MLSGKTVGMSFNEWTHISTLFLINSSSNSFVNIPFPPNDPTVLSKILSPVVFIGFKITFIFSLIFLKYVKSFFLTFSDCFIANGELRVPIIISLFA